MLTLEEGADRTIGFTRIRADERVLVLYDDVSNAGPAWALRRSARALGANAHVRYLDRTASSGWQDPLDTLVDELVDVDVVLAFTRTTVLASEAAFTVVSHGARIYTMTGASEQMLTQGAIEADFTALAPGCDFLAERLTDATHAELYSPAGTRLTMSLTGRQGVPNPPSRPKPGVYRFPYAGVIVAPVESSVEGTIVVDVSTSGGRVDRPAALVVEGGRVVAVSGGAAGERIEDFLGASDDALVTYVGLIGFGMNPVASMYGPEYERVAVAGTGHLSLGPNRGIGGANHGGRYAELAYARPSLVLNGTQVMRAGVLESPLAVS